MTTTVFTDHVTLIEASWLNDVNTSTYGSDMSWINSTELHAGWAAFAASPNTTVTTISTGDSTGKYAGLFAIQSNEVPGTSMYWSLGAIADNNQATHHIATALVVGRTYTILTTGTTDFTLIGAINSNPGTTFVATGTNTGLGTGTVIEVNTVYGIYVEAYKQATCGAGAITQGMEIAVFNKHNSTAITNPYATNTPGLTEGLRLIHTSLGLTTYDCSQALAIVTDSGSAWQTGINFGAGSITTNGVAIAFAQDHQMAWFTNTPGHAGVTSIIRCDGTDTAKGMRMIFSDSKITFQDHTGSTELLTITDTAPSVTAGAIVSYLNVSVGGTARKIAVYAV